jgi:uncharacterized protein YwgA
MIQVPKRRATAMDFDKDALVLGMIEVLASLGSRTGKTHVVKGLFLGHAAGALAVPFEFFLYKHGPYSTDIESTLEQMKSYGAITVQPAYDGYGVILRPCDMADFVKRRAPLTAETRSGIDRVCRFIQAKNVGQLERLATAAWIRTREGVEDPDAVAERLNQLKPHISVKEARDADAELLTFLRS